MTGGAGRDTPIGDSGNNILRGMHGADTIIGGAGFGMLDGGGGSNDTVDYLGTKRRSMSILPLAPYPSASKRL